MDAVFLFSMLATPVLAGDKGIPQADDVKQLLRQAQKHVNNGSSVEAEALYRRVLKLQPKNSEAKVELALLLAKRRQLGEAYKLSFAVAEAEPRNARAFAVLGATLLSAGRFPEARVLFYTALSNDRSEDLAWAGCGMLDFYENRLNKAITNLEQAVYYKPGDPDHQFALAQVLARAERYKQAADVYKKYLAVSHDTDEERRERIKGLINFLRYLGERDGLYLTGGTRSTTVNFRLVGNRPIIRVSVNGESEPLNFVLDTGSGISVISNKTANRIGIKPVTKGGYAKGLGGDGKFEIVYGFLRQVGIGDVMIRSVPVYIREFHSASEDIDGYIGLSLISKFLTTVDYGAQTFSLQRIPDKSDKSEDKENLSLPLRLTSSGFLSGEV